MHTPRLRIAVPLFALIIGFGIARAMAEDAPPPDVDGARMDERHAIEPGAESLFGEMLGKGESFPGGCKLTDGKIERTQVLATYTCGDAQVVLQLLHPDGAPAGGVRTDRFAVNVQSGAPPGGLVEAVADKIRAHEAGFTWTDVGNTGARRPIGGVRWLLALVVLVAAFLVYRAMRRRAPSTSSD